jgi:hypothetical protein
VIGKKHYREGAEKVWAPVVETGALSVKNGNNDPYVDCDENEVDFALPHVRQKIEEHKAGFKNN